MNYISYVWNYLCYFIVLKITKKNIVGNFKFLNNKVVSKRLIKNIYFW